MKILCDRALCWVVALALGGALSARAGAFRLPDQDAFATARGEAFAATADNPSAIYYNPAGIAQLDGSNFRGGIYGIYLDPHYESPGGQDSVNDDPLHAVPQLFYTYGKQGFPLSFGFGVYSPYGLGLKWPQDTGFRTIGTQSQLTYITLNPVVAWKVLPSLSIGAGLTANYSDVDLREGLVWPNEGYDRFMFEGDGWDIGYNLGVLWKPYKKVALGASFRSPTTVGLGGHTEYYNAVPFPSASTPIVPAFPNQRVGAEADFPFPLNAIFGISYRPTEKWNLEFDADYTDWSAVGTVNVQQSAGFAPLLPRNIPVVLDWQPSWFYEFGATRYLGGGWRVSAGYIYNENSIPDAHYTPLVADEDKHFLSLGIGRRGKRFDFDVAYQFGYGPTRTVSGSAPSAIGQTADGSYEYFSHAILLTAGLHF
jgi:long-chain fatty acid transport protein